MSWKTLKLQYTVKPTQNELKSAAKRGRYISNSLYVDWPFITREH